MFSLGLSSVLGNRDNSNKKGHSTKNDEWYIPYNGPYEAPPRDATTWMRKPRDSWGDPVPLGIGDENLELSGSEGIGSNRSGYERHTAYSYAGDAGMKYGVHGVFDDDWKGIAGSGVGRYGGAFSEDRERGRRISPGNDYRPAVGPVDAGKNKFSPAARRRSTISSGDAYGVPDYVSLDRTSGGVGESPVPYSRGPKDTQRVSLASIFTFGAKMKTGSPTRSLDGRERRDSTGSSLKRSRRNTGSTKDKAHGRVDMSLEYRNSAGSFGDNVQHQNHPATTVSIKQSTTKKRLHHAVEQSDRHNSLGADDEVDYNYYDSFYSTLVDDSPTDTKYLASRQSNRQQHLPTTLDNANIDHRNPQLQQRLARVLPRQKSISTPGGHPYAPYSHHNPVGQDHNQDLHDDRIPSPSGRVLTVDKPPVFRQPRHPYNQAQSTHTRHPYGQSSVSTGASSSSHQSQLPTSRSTPSHGHRELQQTSTNPHSKVVFPTQSTVASELGSSGVGTTALGLGAGLTKTVRNSTSTPNLRHNQVGNFRPVVGPSNRQVEPSVPLSMAQQKHPPLVIKDRWLSAETWCDALLFPRPRLKVKQDGTSTNGQPSEKSPIASQKGSGRIVSPPGSPLGNEWTTNATETRNRFGQNDQMRREPSVVSRVLAHSRSLADLTFSTTQEKAGYMPPGIASTSTENEGRRGTREAARVAGSISPEALALPTVVPSVADVLAERQLLEEERLAWQTLAFNSLGNKRTRSLSRTRTKSLTKRGRASMRKKPNGDVDAVDDRSTADDQDTRSHGHLRQNSFEYLAAQACLGNQNLTLTPNIAPPKLGFSTPPPDDTINPGPGITRAISTGGSSGHPSRGSHSHSNSHGTSIVRTMTSKSIKSQKQSHSRNGSWNNTAAGRMVKFCGNPGADVDLYLDDVKSTNISGNVAPASEGIQHRATPDLEGALKRQGTKVIRLADPAHIPVDKGMPVSQFLSSNPVHHQRKTPSPALSASSTSVISESKVGIALGVPPEEAKAIAAGRTYVPSHPYAQGGLSFSNLPPSSGSVEAEGTAESPGGSLTVSGYTPVPISDILARQKHIAHPYSTGLPTTDESKVRARYANLKEDSYLESDGLIAQFRSEGSKPSPSKMWAQLSPGVVREILPGDLQYSPYASESGGTGEHPGFHMPRGNRGEEDKMKSIHDTAGVTEALLNTTRFDFDKPHSVPSPLSQSNDGNMTQSVALFDVNRAATRLGPLEIPSSPSEMVARARSLEIPNVDRQGSISSVLTSGSSSSQLRLLGSPNDLESFHDLFYQPSHHDNQLSESPDTAIPANAGMSWDAAVRNRRTGSSLTTLARQLGEEYETIAAGNASTVSSLYSHSRSRSLSALPQHSGPFGLSTEGHLHFVLEEVQHGESPAAVLDVDGALRAFQLPRSLPEDVESSRASSLIDNPEEEDDPTAMLRLGVVESVSTPSAITPGPGQRISFNGETIFGPGNDGHDEIRNSDQFPIALRPGATLRIEGRSNESEDTQNASNNQNSALLSSTPPHPLSLITRSSYMTTSDHSRMSGLSDFPIPPNSVHSEHDPNISLHLTPQAISLFKSRIDGELHTKHMEHPGSSLPPSSSPTAEDSQMPLNVALGNSLPDGGQVEFGSNQSADELALSLSSPYPFAT